MNYQILDTIKQAARNRQVLRIFYIEKDGTTEGWRSVEPYSFSKDDGEQGLFAWDRTKNGIRRFSIDRISRAEISSETYMPRYQIEIL
ncbi:MAG: Helix-turn-helix type 11 domain protein [Candidatus Azambacteria bacterium GW2011_GWE1_42_9]|nr:MAG: Helix-turn-helix type 11 domain protein [Candidatus Azambacteria bacterium GW2011_GWF1_41_10]KKS49547.1 MAG: Helix-turn-helix type 11 domain protein [Candidatus Azambacteria bacterium GW2011_GWF2_42_22]KKS69428.1 MAG: Helix-turn-helix type 11 domain protein [Candidatus Azambacteria bacterium GW2011_GWA2_42_62]KKS74362.1 MAG: Helix-turn-helix type 11 domain protein [Candidatus Azambacteria bacterium GW2011_GWB1_42_72]KKS78941.1 MAG: Helix-turn-helix type 11 domain protein [Candidatus Aza